MSNVEKMLSKPFKGGFLREVLGEELCDQVGIFEGMRLDTPTLSIMLEKANERQQIDFGHILTVKSCAGRRYVQRLDEVPNLKMYLNGSRHPCYFTLAPGKLYEWADYDDSVRNLYRVVAPLIFKQMGIEVSGANLQRIQEVLKFVCPVFWFEYNFVTKRFNMRTPTGVIIRRIKQSQYGVFYREPKMVIAIEEHNHYALAMHTNKDIVLGEWLNHENNMMTWQLETEMVKHMSSVGWNAKVKIATNPSMMDGCIEEWADDLAFSARTLDGSTVRVQLDPRDPNPLGTVAAVEDIYNDHARQKAADEE